MARTKASVGAKVSSAKSSKARAAAPPPPSPRAESSARSGRSSLAGANPVCQRETPAWQLPITRFFNHKGKPDGDSADEAGPSTVPAPVHSDDEDDLPELNGESSHKIAEYFPKVTQMDTETDKENVSAGNARDVEMKETRGKKRSLDTPNGSGKRVKL